MARGDGFSNRRLRTIRPKKQASSRCERMKFGHTRERRRQNLGAVLARVVPRFGCQRWMPRQFPLHRHPAKPDPRDRAPTPCPRIVSLSEVCLVASGRYENGRSDRRAALTSTRCAGVTKRQLKIARTLPLACLDCPISACSSSRRAKPNDTKRPSAAGASGQRRRQDSS